MSISRAAIKQLTAQFGEPVTLRFASKGDDVTTGAVRDHCEKSLNNGGYLCIQGPNEGELSIFPLPEETPARTP